MKRRVREKKRLVLRLWALLLSASLAAGCGPGFAYQRKATPAAAGAPQIPLKVAVLAFEDGTENFTRRGSLFSGCDFNLAKDGINAAYLGSGAAFVVSALPAELWAKSFAEDLRASGVFRSVRVAFTPSELAGEDIVVEGTLTKAYFTTVKNKPDEFALHVRARRISDNTVVWEGDPREGRLRPRDLTKGCLIGDCVVERIHGYLNEVMQAIFAQARAGLVQALGAQAPAEPSPSPGESPEDVIRRILEKS